MTKTEDIERTWTIHPAVPSIDEGGLHLLTAIPEPPLPEGSAEGGDPYNYNWIQPPGSTQCIPATKPDWPPRDPMAQVYWSSVGAQTGYNLIQLEVTKKSNGNPAGKASVMVHVQPFMKSLAVTLTRPGQSATDDQDLWSSIRIATESISWRKYLPFMDGVLCKDEAGADESLKAVDPHGIRNRRLPAFPGIDQYQLLKTATEIFLMSHCGVYTEFPPPPQEKTPLAKAAATKTREEEFLERAEVLKDDEEARRLGRDSAFTREGLLACWRHYTNTAGSDPKTPNTLPYLALIRRRLKDVPLKQAELGAADNCYGILQEKLIHPCFLELIWSYWHEESMLVQSSNAICRRFQNIRGEAGRDPLAELEISPLRPLNNILWGYVQDEQHRLSLARRAYEYDHHYGLRLRGRAVPTLPGADSRSKFLEGLHNTLHLCSRFFRESDDTTVVADAFPILNSLKEVHLLLAEGAHNQYGDLPWNARLEMLMQQWILARPEMREFLPGRAMVPYPEDWMDRVESMKRLQGWNDISTVHFHDLAVFGEQILLGIRFGNWTSVHQPEQAGNWALYWRAEIQGYIHAYRVVTGVDLSAEPVNATMPSLLLAERARTRRP